MSTGTKITKAQLKSIVKECLVEILQEGLSGQVQAVSSAPNPFLQVAESRGTQRQPVAQKQTRKSPLDYPAQQTRQSQYSTSLAQAIKAEARGNPIMADIFADTAMNTLPKMMSGGDTITESTAGVSKMAQQEQFAGTPEQVFGEEVASKWANLAFMDAPPRN